MRTNFELDIREAMKEIKLGYKLDKQKAIIKVQSREIGDVYDIQELIGEGGYGKVYKAQHKETGILRAVKCLKKKTLDQENMKSILTEFETLKKLDHPNLVKLIEHYEDQNYIFLVQEYLGGLQLYDRLCEREQFAEVDARSIFKQALMAISYLH